MPPTRKAALAALASLSATLCAGCARAPVAGTPLPMRPPGPVATVPAGATTPADPDPGFTEQGRIQFTPMGTPGASAAWDARSVRGPAVNMTLTDEGLWGGTLRNRPVLLRAAAGRITGEGVNVFVRQEGPVVHVQGMWFGSLLRIDVSPTTLSASPTGGVCSMELALAEDGYWRGFGGCGGRLSYTWMTLEGVAGDPSGEMPQWLFAFLASLPSRQTTVFPNPAFAGSLAPRSGFLPASVGGPQVALAAAMPCSPWSPQTCGPGGWSPTVNGWFGAGAARRPVALDRGAGKVRPVGASRGSAAGTGRGGATGRGAGGAGTGAVGKDAAAPPMRAGVAEKRGAGP